MRFPSTASRLARPRLACLAWWILSAALVAAEGGDALAPEPKSTAQINHHLRHGRWSFVVPVAVKDGQRSVTFVNKNIAAEGTLSIAVSNRLLSSDSPFWNDVEGTVSFRHKRLFAFSLVGIEANYVRLTFAVTDQERIAAR